MASGDRRRARPKAACRYRAIRSLQIPPGWPRASRPLSRSAGRVARWTLAPRAVIEGAPCRSDRAIYVFCFSFRNRGHHFAGGGMYTGKVLPDAARTKRPSISMRRCREKNSAVLELTRESTGIVAIKKPPARQLPTSGAEGTIAPERNDSPVAERVRERAISYFGSSRFGFLEEFTCLG